MKDKSTWAAIVGCVSSHGFALFARLVHITICLDHIRAMVLSSSFTVLAFAARVGLRSYANTIADLDVFDLFANLDGFADYLVADTTCWDMSDR